MVHHAKIDADIIVKSAALVEAAGHSGAGAIRCAEERLASAAALQHTERGTVVMVFVVRCE